MLIFNPTKVECSTFLPVRDRRIGVKFLSKIAHSVPILLRTFFLQKLYTFWKSEISQKVLRKSPGLSHPGLADPEGAPAPSFDSPIPLPTATAQKLSFQGRPIGAG